MNHQDDRGAPSPLGAGSRIADRYVVVRRLGEGGMGQVFEVEHEAIGRHFALKILNINPCTEEVLRRFRREARALGRVATPRVAQVTDFGVEQRLGPFYVMELLDGETLEDRLERTHHLPANEAIPIAIDLCEALAEVHAAGIIHRDLKPSNVGLTRTGPVRVKLLDFGLAAALDGAALERITKSQEVVGSLPYMAPERFHGEALTLSIDLYALGVVLYEMLTGDLPFFGASAAVMINQHLSQPPRPFSMVAPDLQIPASLEAIVARLLDKDPAQRFMSAAASARALQAATIDAPVLPTLAEDRGEISVAATVLAESSSELPLQRGSAPQAPQPGWVSGPAAPMLRHDSQAPPSATQPSTPVPPSGVIPTALVDDGSQASWPAPYAPPSAYPSAPPGSQYTSYPSSSSIGASATGAPDPRTAGSYSSHRVEHQSWVSGPIPPTTLKPTLASDLSESSRPWLRFLIIAVAGVIGSMLAAVLAIAILSDDDGGAPSRTREDSAPIQSTAPMLQIPATPAAPTEAEAPTVVVPMGVPLESGAGLSPPPLPLPLLPDAGIASTPGSSESVAEIAPDAGMSVTPTKSPVRHLSKTSVRPVRPTPPPSAPLWTSPRPPERWRGGIIEDPGR
jgi:serine/threonine protein kinase